MTSYKVGIIRCRRFFLPSSPAASFSSYLKSRPLKEQLPFIIIIWLFLGSKQSLQTTLPSARSVILELSHWYIYRRIHQAIRIKCFHKIQKRTNQTGKLYLSCSAWQFVSFLWQLWLPVGSPNSSDDRGNTNKSKEERIKLYLLYCSIIKRIQESFFWHCDPALKALKD